MKAGLQDLLSSSREALLWKLDGLSEYDARRPLMPTGTNVLGLVKHLAVVQALYLGAVFRTPLADAPAWMNPSMNRGDDLWVQPHESRESIVDLFNRANALADSTMDAHELDDVVDVPWVPFLGSGVTMHRVLVHVVGEAQRHLGHADVIRELIDGSAGKQRDDDDLASSVGDQQARQAHTRMIEDSARVFSAQ